MDLIGPCLLVACLGILVGVLALGVLRRLRDPALPSRRQRIGAALGFLGRVLTAMILLALVVGLTLFTFVGGLVLVIFILTGLAEYFLTRRYALLGALATAAERSIPLVPTVRAFAWEHSRYFASRVNALADMLEAGRPLPEALDQSGGLVPRPALPLIHIGQLCGALPAALRQAATMGRVERPVWQALLGRLCYLLCVTYFGLLVLAFIMLRIVPSFEKIFKDFSTELPALTRAVIASAQWFAAYSIVSVPLLLLFTLLVFYAVCRYMGLVTWDLPGVGRLTRRLDTALIFDALALAAERQRPLPGAIVCLARTYPNQSIRPRLALALADITAGGDWCEALRAQGLMRQADLAVLQAAQRVGNLPWALREMADSNRRRLAYRLYALVQVLYPPIIVIAGLLVMVFVVGMFLPLIALIQRLS